MPRTKSAVHGHFKRAADQGERKIELVECVHCGHRTAGNNGARLLKHLQKGCWPASGPEDPALLLNRPHRAPSAAARREESDLTILAPQQRPAVRATPVAAPAMVATSAPITAANRAFATSPFLLINVTVKDTKDPSVCRLLAVPRTFTFRNLQRALSVAFGYRTINGLFDVTYPTWVPGKGRPPRREQLCIFNDEEQRRSWHAWDDLDASHVRQLDERFVDQVFLDALLNEVHSCKIVFHVGPWAHEVDILGGSALSQSIATTRGHAVCLSGQGHPVLETSDPLMWQAFKEAYQTTVPSPTQKSYRIFYEKECPCGDPRGLGGAMTWTWDKDLVNRELRLLPIAVSLPPLMPEEVQHSIDETVDENEVEPIDTGENYGINHGANAHGHYDQNNNRGLHH